MTEKNKETDSRQKLRDDLTRAHPWLYPPQPTKEELEESRRALLAMVPYFAAAIGTLSVIICIGMLFEQWDPFTSQEVKDALKRTEIRKLDAQHPQQKTVYKPDNSIEKTSSSTTTELDVDDILKEVFEKEADDKREVSQ